MADSICIQYYKSPAGELILGSVGDRLCLCDWRYRKMRESIDRRIRNYFGLDYREEHTSLIDAARTELEQYFRKERRDFTIPLSTAGTDFQNNVWDALQQIPYGGIATYQELAQRMARPEAVRAVATANGANAISIFIPCHRIIGSDGELVGYAGGLRAKKLLLDLEGSSPGQYALFD